MGCAQSEIAPQNETPRKGCTDVLWLVIYILFWILMIIVAAISFVYGNPQRLINGFDSFGNTCGVKTNQKLIKFPLAGISTIDKKFLFFMDVKELRRSLKICVKECPNRKLESLADIQNFYRETGSNLCRYDINPNNVTSTKDLHDFIGPCPTLPVYDSFPLLNRCFPKSAKDVAERVVKDFYDLLNSWDTIEQMLSDLYSSWKEMIICVIIAFICSLLMVSILHLLATLVSWIFMIIVSIASVAGTALLWYTYYELKHKQKSFVEHAAFLDESLKNETAFLWYSIIATIITVILLILVFVMRSRVSFLAALFKETAHCLGSIPALFLQPIITFFFLILFFAFWSFVIVCLATANYPGIPYQTNFFINGSAMPDRVDKVAVEAQNINKSASLKNFTLENIEFDPLWVKSMWWICLICLVWGSEFILGCQQMTIAGAVSHWYFRGPNANSPVLYSIGKLLKYHLGSVAKGSFLITLFKIPRLILTYLHAKLSARAEKGSDCAKCGLKCGICCFYCLEKFIRYLNHNAYTIITIERCHFCKAAARAFSTIVNNALQVATINSVGDFILFLGKCIVTAVTGIAGLLLLKRNPDLHFFAVPTLLICIFSFFIAHCILSLYEMVVDSLFMCVCEDRNMNGGDGKWKHSRLAELGGHTREQDGAAELQDLQEKY
ncbi:choline transporter-like 1 isoform X1 [Plodia interpunctella]|uniref:choline transporter-like 1 isoform X1 n=4 Tax=Plodia interpunctella TaxID=58824 RepID=UPI002368D8A3|nr:choline transporter-like 1 isoform X1 [Plodia interpunctella]